MAVQPQTPYIEHIANGTATGFNLGFDCDDQDHLIVLVDDAEPAVGSWSLVGGAVVFGAAPTSGNKITIQRNTPFERKRDYQSYDNSFRPPAVNKDFDHIWLKTQELGVADWLLSNKIQKFRDDVNLTALEETLEQAKEIRDNTADSVIEVQSNVEQSQALLENTTTQSNLAQDSASSANAANAAAQQAVIDVSAAEANVYSALSTQKIAVNDSLTAIAGGHKAYQTLALAQAAQSSLPANTAIEVTNDPTASNNGTYQWDGTTLTKSAYDPLTQSQKYTDSILEKYSEINSLLTDATKQENTLFYNSGDGKVTKETNQQLFAIEVETKAGEYFILNTQRFGAAPAFLIADDEGNILNLAETQASNITLAQSYVIKIPENGSKLYVNCTYDYANANGFSFSKISKNEIELIYDTTRDEFMFFQDLNGIVTQVPHHECFAKQFDVTKNDLYLIDTKTFGLAPEYIVTDANNSVIESRASTNGAFGAYTIRIPDGGVKLYVSCGYAYVAKFNVEKISNKQLTMIAKDGERQDFVFYYEPDGSLAKFMHDEFFSVQLNVKKDQCFCINTGTFGLADEYLITDDEGNVIQKKSRTFSLSDYVIKIPENGAKLYVNCSYEYTDNFSVTAISKSIFDVVNESNGVRNVFPNVNYFDKLRLKCPNFYQKFKDKQQDLTVVLTGTSLTQGNLYVSDRADATTRPALLHTNDLASSVFDKLIQHWDGQKYRRYDHADLTYSGATWSVVNRVLDGSADVWDDYAHIKNGLTKTTTSPNASVSMTIPSNAWQFNFVYRSDKQGGNCTVAITEGNSKVEVFNGTNWVEANGFVFSMLESAATATKGNTIYQKRLKMRCKNKALGGINSIGSTKQITITKANDASRFNVVGFEWSPREFMLSVINGARGSHRWGGSGGSQLEHYQDGDIWEFNPDLILAEITIINWGASDPSAMSQDPLHYVNIAKRAYFNEFNDMPDSLFAKSSGYTACDVVFYSDTIACAPSQNGAWDSVTHEPLFGTVTTAATNGATVDNINIGRTKTNFENHEAVERYMSSKDYLFIPVLGTFKSVAEKYYGSYWQGMQASDKTGRTLSQDTVHFNDNGAALFSKLVASVFDGI